jgi:hypothetical protein
MICRTTASPLPSHSPLPSYLPVCVALSSLARIPHAINKTMFLDFDRGPYKHRKQAITLARHTPVQQSRFLSSTGSFPGDAHICFFFGLSTRSLPRLALRAALRHTYQYATTGVVTPTHSRSSLRRISTLRKSLQSTAAGGTTIIMPHIVASLHVQNYAAKKARAACATFDYMFAICLEGHWSSAYNAQRTAFSSTAEKSHHRYGSRRAFLSLSPLSSGGATSLFAHRSVTTASPHMPRQHEEFSNSHLDDIN